MPQDPVLLKEQQSGEYVYMHSIDAAEGLRLGDYTVVTGDEAKELAPEVRAGAMAKFKGAIAPLHAEMQSQDERDQRRREANAAAGVTPAGRPVTQERAATDRPAAERASTPSARQAEASSTRSETTHPTPPQRGRSSESGS